MLIIDWIGYNSSFQLSLWVIFCKIIYSIILRYQIHVCKFGLSIRLLKVRSFSYFKFIPRRLNSSVNFSLISILWYFQLSIFTNICQFRPENFIHGSFYDNKQTYKRVWSFRNHPACQTIKEWLHVTGCKVAWSLLIPGIGFDHAVYTF